MKEKIGRYKKVYVGGVLKRVNLTHLTLHTFQPSRYRWETADMGHHLPVIPANLPEKLAFAGSKQTFLGQNLVIIFNSPGKNIGNIENFWTLPISAVQGLEDL